MVMSNDLSNYEPKLMLQLYIYSEFQFHVILTAKLSGFVDRKSVENNFQSNLK